MFNKRLGLALAVLALPAAAEVHGRITTYKGEQRVFFAMEVQLSLTDKANKIWRATVPAGSPGLFFIPGRLVLSDLKTVSITVGSSTWSIAPSTNPTAGNDGWLVVDYCPAHVSMNVPLAGLHATPQASQFWPPAPLQ